jgi:aminopeptidase N
VYYNGEPTSTGFGSFNFDTHNNIPHIWTLSEPYGARDWWPCKDDPSDKADSLEISVTIQKDQIVVSNGLLTEEINVNENEKKYTWFESYPICTYLVSITSYPYTVWHDEYISSSGDTLPLDFYVYPENYDIVRDNYLLTNDMLSVFAEKFGEYPFMNEKYGHAEFGRGGGMEHQTISSMGGYSEWLIAHELGHQWWGDLVTCADFHHIWLNEGFARFSESIWEEAKGGAEAYKDYWRNHTFYGPGTVYVENPISTSQIFNGNLTYNKAGWVVHMLRGVLGDSLFFQSLQAYASDDSLSYNAVTTENFKNVCENISGIPLDSFFQQWIYGEFYPKYSLSWDMIDSDLLSIRIEQVQNWQYFEMPIDLLIYTDLDTIKLTVNNNTQDQEYQIGIDNGFVQRIELDPDNWILKEVQYLSLNGNIPDNYEVIMYPAYPNPFNPKVNIDFFVPDEFGEFQSRIFIYNLSGRLIEELMPMKSYPGINKISWNSLNNASGTYFISIEADKKIHTQKIQLVK